MWHLRKINHFFYHAEAHFDQALEM